MVDSFGRNGVEFVDEYRAGRHLFCHIKHGFNELFRVSSPLGDQRARHNVEKRRIALGSHGLGQQSLSLKPNSNGVKFTINMANK